MKKLFVIFVILALAGCFSTGVVLMEKDKYMVSKRSAKPGRGPAYGVQADMYQEANEFCAKQNKDVQTVNLIMVDAEFAKPACVTLEFRCVAKEVLR